MLFGKIRWTHRNGNVVLFFNDYFALLTSTTEYNNSDNNLLVAVPDFHSVERRIPGRKQEE